MLQFKFAQKLNKMRASVLKHNSWFTRTMFNLLGQQSLILFGWGEAEETE
jgi:hypothetical protein